MLSARHAVEAILAGSPDKSAIWAVNIDDDADWSAAERALLEVRGEP